MIRQVARGLIALVGITLLIDSAIGQQPTTVLDRVAIRDKKDGSVKTLEGVLQFGPAGLLVVGEGKKTLAVVSPSDVVKVTPGEMDKVDMGKIREYLGLEEKKTKADYAKARLGYTDLKKTAAAAPERTKRYLDYKLALLASRIADETSYEEEWPKVALEAAKGWGDFVAEYKTGYEVWAASRASARLYAELNKFDEVARTWNRMTKKEVGLPADLLLEAQMQEIDAQIRTRTGAAAAQVAASALAGTAPGTAKDKLVIYDLAAKAMAGGDPKSGVKAIEEKIAATKDSATRGVGFGMIGELYKAAEAPRDAMWAFLWVETVYNADKEEAFKAMCRLADVFKSQADDDKVRAYHEKLRRARGNF